MSDLRRVRGEISKVELSEKVLERIKEAQGMIDLSLDVHDLTYHSAKLLGQTRRVQLDPPVGSRTWPIVFS